LPVLDTLQKMIKKISWLVAIPWYSMIFLCVAKDYRISFYPSKVDLETCSSLAKFAVKSLDLGQMCLEIGPKIRSISSNAKSYCCLNSSIIYLYYIILYMYIYISLYHIVYNIPL
jgi:hypothetical protein